MATTHPPRHGASGPPARPRPDVGWTELVVAAVALLALQVVGAVVLVATGSLDVAALVDPDAGADGPGAVRDTILLLALGAVATAGAVAAALAVRVRSTRPLALRRPSWAWAVVGAACGVGMVGVSLVVGELYSGLTGDTEDPQLFLESAATTYGVAWASMLLLVVVAVPVAEELLFRGIGYTALRRHGPVVATVGSALLFGLAHGVNTVLPVAVVLGVVSAVLFERSGSIWPSVLAHVVFNGVGFAVFAELLG